MKNRKLRWFDIAEPVFIGFQWAVVLAHVALVFKYAGFRGVPFIAIPIWCAYNLGENRGYNTGWGNHKRIVDQWLDEVRK